MDQLKAKENGKGLGTIFVVDDEPSLLDLATSVLAPLGYDVQTFVNPKFALAAFTARKPAVVVTDYAMAEMSGIDLIRECKRLNPEQKFMLVSGTIDENIYADSFAKPDIFLNKPYSTRELIDSVKKLATS